jgi:hypothetical protein
MRAIVPGVTAAFHHDKLPETIIKQSVKRYDLATEKADLSRDSPRPEMPPKTARAPSRF